MIAGTAAVFAHYVVDVSGPVSSLFLSAATISTLASRKNGVLRAQSLGFAVLFLAALLMRLVL